MALAAAAVLGAALATRPAFDCRAILRGSAQQLSAPQANEVVRRLQPLFDEVPDHVTRRQGRRELPELLEQKTAVADLGERSAHRQLDEALPAFRFSAAATQENGQRRTFHRRRRSTGTGGAPPGCLNQAEGL